MMEEFDYNRSMVSFEKPGADILKTGFLKKLKTNKRKFFVLRSTSTSGPARLEYYDSEKKYKSGQLPKKSVPLHKCFNINKKSDTKHKLTIALYLVDDCFSVIADNNNEFDEWLNLLLEYQTEYFGLYDDIIPKVHYEYIWQVTIRPKGLAVKQNMCGQYRLCLSNVAVVLYKNNSEKAEYVFQLASIRRCGHMDNFFYMEVGRSAPTGDGELWIQVDDKDIAQGLHEEVLKHMRTSSNIEENASFRQRSNTGSRQHVNTIDDSSSVRLRTNSDSIPHGSPRRARANQENKRPQSTVVTSRPPTLPAVSEPQRQSLIAMGTSPQSALPHSYINELAVPNQGYRFRSDSTDSHSSRCSVKSTDLFGSSPAEMFMHPMNRAMTPDSLPKPITEETSSYFDMSPGHMSPTPSPPRERPERPERPGSAHSGSGSDSHDSSSKVDGYMDMLPGSVGSDKNTSSYLDMAPVSKEIVVLPNETGYLVMGPGQNSTSSPIVIRPKEPGYLDMAAPMVGPSSQPLPTVKEGGSGEAYLPMTPTGTSPIAAELKPAKVISYLSDDSMSGDFPKRAYSVGSRPVKPITHRHHHPTETVAKQSVSDNGRSSSAPHLIVQKIKRENSALKNNPLMNNPYMSMDGSNSNYSPMSNYLNSDTDSFMEMDFYRPRTSSESFGSRPRSSSFNKVFSQGHRPRSSSYGQNARGGKMGSFESVRTTSKDLLHRLSHESVNRLSSPSSRTSSLESLRRIDNQSRCSNQSDYVDMQMDKKDNNSGYIDMTLPGGHSKGRSGASRSSSNQSLSSSPAVPGFVSPVAIDKHLPNSPDIKIVKPSGHIVQKPTGFHAHSLSEPSQSLFSPLSYTSPSGSRSPSVTGRSSAGSGRESEDDSYVPFEPSIPTSKDGKMSKKESGRKKERSSKKDGKHSPVISKSSPKSERTSKEKHVTETEDSYLEYEPGIISDLIPGSQEHHGKSTGHSDNKTTTASQPSKNTLKSVDSNSSSVKSSVSTSAKNSAIPVESSDSGYMDYQPPQPEKSVTSAKSKESDTKPEEKTKEVLSQDNSGKKSAGILRRNSSSNKSFEEDKPAVIEKKESYKYMEFDPRNHSVDEEEEKEVKSPTRVRSYIAASSMEAESKFVTPPSKTLPKVSDDKKGDDKSVQKVQLVKDESDLKDKGPVSDLKDKGPVSDLKDKGPVSEDTGSIQKQDVVRPKTYSSDNMKQKQTITKTSNSSQEGSKSQKKKEKKRKDGSIKKEKSDTESAPKPFIYLPTPEEEEDDGYVGLDFSKDVTDKPSIEPPFSNIISGQNHPTNVSDSAPFKLKALPVPELVTMDTKTFTKVDSKDSAKGSHRLSPGLKVNIENKNIRKISLPKGKGNHPLPILPGRKSSVSSLDEMCLEESVTRKDSEGQGYDQDRMKMSPKLIMPTSELHKQNSMPCMTLPPEMLAPKTVTVNPAPVEEMTGPRSRHSCSDLTSTYEQMTFPPKEPISAGHQAPTNSMLMPSGAMQSQLTPPSAGVQQPQLNYVSLDLGSSENVNNGDPKSPRIKSRHSSSADEAIGPPLSYAEIDFKMSESLKNSNTNNKECKFSFE